MKALVKFEIIMAAACFALIFVAGAAGHFAGRAGVVDPKTAERAAQAAMLVLFCFFGFACIGLMIHVFAVMQVGIGNGEAPMVRFMRDHESGVTFAAWGFLGLGAIIAIPAALYDMGFRLPLRSQGILVADIGITVDEVMRRSTIHMAKPGLMSDGSRFGAEEVLFEFQIGDSAIHFPLSRYYWIQTQNDPHVSVMNIGVTPRKMPKADLDAFQHAAQIKLQAEGWMPGHYVAKDERTVRLWGGQRTTQDGRYWLRNNTVICFERKRMDDRKPDEPPDAGEYIVDLHIETRADAADVVFEPSAWRPDTQ